MMARGLGISAIVVAAMAGLSAWGWSVTPQDAQIPVHWSATGEVNRYGGRFEAFGVMPLLALGLSGLLAIAPKIDPRGRNLAKSGPLYLTVWMGTLGLLFTSHLVLVLSATGHLNAESPLLPRILLIAVALFLAIIGNLLGKARPNWFIGVRTPWTLSSDRSWDVTHRWTGRGFVATGLLGGAALLLTPVKIGLAIFFGLLGVTVAGALVISYLAWRDDPSRETFSETD